MSIARLIERTVDINQALRCENLGTFFKHDSLAHTFLISVVSNGQPVNLTGYSAVAYFNRPTADTVPVVGSVTGNVVSVTLAEACYVYEGHFNLVIRLTDGGDSKIAIYWADGNVRIDSNDATVDPGGVVPDLTELLAKIDQMEQATASAREATSDAENALSEIKEVLPIDKSGVSFFHNATIGTTGEITEGTTTRLLSDLFTADVDDTFTLPSGYGLRVAGYKDGAFVALPVNAWESTFTVSAYMEANYDSYRINIRNNNNTSARITPADITYTTTIDDLIAYAPIASQADVSAAMEDVRESVGTTLVKTYPVTADGQSITIDFNIFAKAGNVVKITQKAGRISANTQYAVTFHSAEEGQGSSMYGGVSGASQAFTFSQTAEVDCSGFTLSMIAAGVGTHKFEILIGETALTLYSESDTVTMTAAQLRQLLALLN